MENRNTQPWAQPHLASLQLSLTRGSTSASRIRQLPARCWSQAEGTEPSWRALGLLHFNAVPRRRALHPAPPHPSQPSLAAAAITLINSAFPFQKWQLPPFMVRGNPEHARQPNMTQLCAGIHREGPEKADNEHFTDILLSSELCSVFSALWFQTWCPSESNAQCKPHCNCFKPAGDSPDSELPTKHPRGTCPVSPACLFHCSMMEQLSRLPCSHSLFLPSFNTEAQGYPMNHQKTRSHLHTRHAPGKILCRAQ